MLLAAAACFALAALGGLGLLSFVLRGLPTPKGLAIGHGVLAATGLALLTLNFVAGEGTPPLSLGLFVAAAAGGFFLLYRDLVHGKVPRSIAVVHGLVAVTAFLILLRALLA